MVRGRVDAAQACPARRPARLLRRASTGPCIPSRRRSSCTAPRSTSASRSCTTSTSSSTLEGRGRDLRRGDRRGARGRDRRLLRPRRRARRCTSEAAARGAADDRRDLPAGHQGAPRGQAVRRRGLRHPADRPRGPRGGRRHRRARRPSTSTLVDGPDDVDQVDGARPGQGRLAVADHPVGRRDDGDGRPAARALPAAAVDPPSDDICYATQNRQVAVKEIAPRVRPGDRRRLAQLLELGAARRGRPGRRARTAAYLVDDAERDRRRLARRRRRRSGVTSGASVPEVLVDAGAGAGWPSAASTTVDEVSPAEESLIFALPQELRRDLKAAGEALGSVGAGRGGASPADEHDARPPRRCPPSRSQGLRRRARSATSSSRADGCECCWGR